MIGEFLGKGLKGWLGPQVFSVATMCSGQARTRLESCWGLAEWLRQDHIKGLEEEPQQARWWLISHG